ncbi:hypothetical protein BCV69DRAFT_71328 [Microstroma glucosiphilum]|uniref:Uncharacterized protein n=1 Tax=Pseudomicrostroma glucosiphilum TaxID=1684307 RepID=A0A316TYT5_9BASI|nr:hypothetical protein BCV69DRAFT_71328 [Pseudomicrostroma glucosiphilum]PWN18382.1 hypothetical protein BCV69DRAFT_71328 [Pseudomicrostroma glucosiphilum]
MSRQASVAAILEAARNISRLLRMELERPFQEASQVGLFESGPKALEIHNGALPSDHMLSLQHWPYIGCCAMVASYAGLIAFVANDCPGRQHPEPKQQLRRLRIAEIASHIDLAEGSLGGLAEAWPLVHSFRQEISHCKEALQALSNS